MPDVFTTRKDSCGIWENTYTITPLILKYKSFFIRIFLIKMNHEVDYDSAAAGIETASLQ